MSSFCEHRPAEPAHTTKQTTEEHNMLVAIVWLTIFTFIPALELRASIPIGIFGMPESIFGIDLAALGAPVAALGPNGDLSWPIVVLICVVGNTILGWIVFAVLGPVFTFIRKWAWFERRIWPILDKTQHKIRPFVDRYGELGVAVFIGIPLPGSGVYTGAFGAYLLGLDKKKFAIANVIGVLIAASAVTALSLLLLHGAVGDKSWIAKIFLKAH
jgi:uncharacterized membrane protein